MLWPPALLKRSALGTHKAVAAFYKKFVLTAAQNRFIIVAVLSVQATGRTAQCYCGSMAEHLTRNEKVVSSILTSSSKIKALASASALILGFAALRRLHPKGI